jgi:hypothetical protein
MAPDDDAIYDKIGKQRAEDGYLQRLLKFSNRVVWSKKIFPGLSNFSDLNLYGDVKQTFTK